MSQYKICTKVSVTKDVFTAKNTQVWKPVFVWEYWNFNWSVNLMHNKKKLNLIAWVKQLLLNLNRRSLSSYLFSLFIKLGPCLSGLRNLMQHPVIFSRTEFLYQNLRSRFTYGSVYCSTGYTGCTCTGCTGVWQVYCRRIFTGEIDCTTVSAVISIILLMVGLIVTNYALNKPENRWEIKLEI